jgi:AbrB family looped-hinge helix DNA binding protein
VKATITSKGQITIPCALRERLGLAPGQILEFDETAPFLKAVPAFDEKKMWAQLGRTKGKLGMSTEEWLSKTRGRPVKLK